MAFIDSIRVHVGRSPSGLSAILSCRNCGAPDSWYYAKDPDIIHFVDNSKKIDPHGSYFFCKECGVIQDYDGLKFQSFKYSGYQCYITAAQPNTTTKVAKAPQGYVKCVKYYSKALIEGDVLKLMTDEQINEHCGKCARSKDLDTYYYVCRKDGTPWGGFYKSTFELVGEDSTQKQKRTCECGSHTAKGPLHSSWCPDYDPSFKPHVETHEELVARVKAARKGAQTGVQKMLYP